MRASRGDISSTAVLPNQGQTTSPPLMAEPEFVTIQPGSSKGSYADCRHFLTFVLAQQFGAGHGSDTPRLILAQ